MQRPPATAMVKVAFVDMPECRETLDEKRLECLAELRNLMEFENGGNWAPPTNWADGAIRSSELTPLGRKLELFAIYAYSGDTMFADMTDSIVGYKLPPGEHDAVGYFLRKHRCVVDTMWAGKRRAGRRVFGLDGEIWFEDEERLGKGFADDPPLGKIIDDYIAPYIIRRTALG